MRRLTLNDVKAAVKGGSIFASGGGGWVDHGLEIGSAAITIGRPKLVSIDELPDDAIIVTATAIGAPAGTTDWQMLGKDYIKAVQLLQERLGRKITGLMTPQNGMSSSINGWLPAAALDLVVVDAVGDIRAHPTGKMGSLGLAGSLDYETIQVVAGGKPETGSYIELVVTGTPAKTSNILRIASDMSGGFIACARHPLPAKFIKENAALGGISRAIELGNAIIKAEKEDTSKVVDAICQTTKGKIIGQGTVIKKEIRYSVGYDIGTITIDTEDGLLTLHVMNEYMAVDNQKGQRVASFPDVITTLEPGTGRPVSVGHVKEGEQLSIFNIAKENLPLSTGVKDSSVYPEVEKVLGIDLAKYALEGHALVR
ncbi:DUF917 domain-containing protein [Bacillus gobiensis]|uniref:DUF917 domain-containing protein n=1 Tax=Bacillus gobiensis TaxID=1441095 RepID=UPI003D1E534B